MTSPTSTSTVRSGDSGRRRTLGQLKNSMPYLLESAPKRQNNVIIRPHGTTAQLIQLDDLNAEALQHVRPAAFLTLQTSPGNHQAWVAVASPPADLAGDSGKEATPTRVHPEPPASPARSTISASTSRIFRRLGFLTPRPAVL